MNFEYILVVVFVITGFLASGSCATRKYRRCKVKCLSLGLSKCYKICRINKDDVFNKSCWNDCSRSLSANDTDASTLLRGCLQQCKVVKQCEPAYDEADFEKIVDKQNGTEGPVFTQDDNLYITLYEQGEIRHIDLKNKKANLLVAPSVDGFKGMPAGLQCDKDNIIWAIDVRLGLLKVYQNGTFQQMVKRDSDGNAVKGGDDLVFDYHGNLWITAPFDPIAPHSYIDNLEKRSKPTGVVYCYNKTTAQLVKVASEIIFPNGIAVQHDATGKPVKLIFGASYNINAPLWSYDIVGPCQIENKQVWGNLPRNSIADGMDFDEDGNLLVIELASGFLYVFGPNGGSAVCQIKLPFTIATNLHFRPNSNEIYITESEFDGVWKLNWTRKGMKHYCDRI